MAWTDWVVKAAETVRKALPPCHICGDPGAQLCRVCGKIACHKHAFTNMAAMKSVCNSCMPFAWVQTEASGMPITPDWPYSQPPWVVLGVAQIATVDEIKEAHRTLSKQCHPDKGGSADQQVQINKARDEMLKARPV